MAKFTKEQIEEAKAEFFSDADLSIEWGMRPGAGNNGPITVYKKEEQSNGTDERPSN